MTKSSEATGKAGPAAIVVGLAEGRIWGMSSAERLQRIFRRLGLQENGATASATQAVLAVDARWVFDEALIRALAQQPNVILVDDDGVPAAIHGQGEAMAVALERLAAGEDIAAVAPDYPRLTALEVGSTYNSELRKKEPPILRRLTTANVREVEKRLFQGSYKGVTDLVTKYVWPAPARVVTRWCALAGVTPNQVTFASFLLVLAAFALFWTGHFGWGLVAAWGMTFLDTVDGKLARVTLTSSKMGNVFDHGIDLIHPPFWWWAWLVGVQAGPHPLGHAELILAVIVGGYVVQRMLEGVFLGLFKVEMHAWRPFDSFFRLITARRNPNLIMLTGASLVGRPDIGLLLVAIWTALSLLVHLVQVLQGLITPRGQVTSWLSR
ncbi:MAG: CDP-alcohol phosphatidyltransferase family protein [Phenylobacterium sp.]|nr:CDP-alcohol phosphatidyltransferase family protein [Phenylobacterium sp.]MDP1601465.1 CDP-alcohol phosphatidyltransferase family protein [Phenylobacterium sp.]MDP3592594.1 CDP-alcohol phosphatidyltransferase family protein [Phenylobacterium sp.]